MVVCLVCFLFLVLSSQSSVLDSESQQIFLLCSLNSDGNDNGHLILALQMLLPAIYVATT